MPYADSVASDHPVQFHLRATMSDIFDGVLDLTHKRFTITIALDQEYLDYFFCMHMCINFYFALYGQMHN